jgi:hypothetical protein
VRIDGLTSPFSSFARTMAGGSHGRTQHDGRHAIGWTGDRITELTYDKCQQAETDLVGGGSICTWRGVSPSLTRRIPLKSMSWWKGTWK